MKLSFKLPLAFALCMGLLLLGALFGMFRLNASLNVYEDDVLATVAAHKKVAVIDSHFSTAIQEWKNVLLRGREPKDLAHYWASHEKSMRAVSDGLLELKSMRLQPDAQSVLAQLEAAVADVAGAYVKGFQAFEAAGRDPLVGDKAARGKDRRSSELMRELKSKLSDAERVAAQQASDAAHRNVALALSVMLAVTVTVAGLVGGIWLSRKIVRPLVQAVRIAEEVAQGRLTNVIAASGQDEVADLLRSLQEMQSKLSELVLRVRRGSEAVAAASAEIAQGNHDLSARTEQQASALEQTAASMEELGTTVTHNAQSARQANQLAMGASSVAAQGGVVVDQVVQTMRGIHESSSKIADIIGVIDSIAFQTNILALNAAVEAARAGEQGRGFAVVASEVRALAGRSAQAAKEIKSLIDTSVERVGHGAQLVDQAGVTMKEVVDSIRRVTDIVGEISAASQEQSSGVQQVGHAVTQMDQTTQQNAALVEQMAAATTGLKNQAHALVQTVAAFQVQGETASGMPSSIALLPAVLPLAAGRSRR